MTSMRKIQINGIQGLPNEYASLYVRSFTLLRSYLHNIVNTYNIVNCTFFLQKLIFLTHTYYPGNITSKISSSKYCHTNIFFLKVGKKKVFLFTLFYKIIYNVKGSFDSVNDDMCIVRRSTWTAVICKKITSN